MGKKKKDKYQRIPLSKYTIGGRIATVLAVIALILLGVAIAISIMARGNAGREVGIMAGVTFLLAIIGFIAGIASFTEETKFLTYSWIGTLMNMAICTIMAMMILIYN
ncbi:MAG: hypothetical protein IKN54_07585 [Lachnospiraceae bacterium]|nr:hypothetical protein [Lachnospiraceae bacterium]